MIEAPYPYRAGELGDRDTAMTGEALDDAIERRGPRTLPRSSQNQSAEARPARRCRHPVYYGRIREICDRYGVLFIADEVLCGVGRTGKFFGLEHFKDADGKVIVPDIITLGKGLNGGYVPLSAMLTTSRIFEVMAKIAAAVSSTRRPIRTIRLQRRRVLRRCAISVSTGSWRGRRPSAHCCSRA